MADPKQPYSEADVDEFLKLMSQLESSGGKNTSHSRLPSGEQAYGQYGLLPSTAQDMAKKKIKDDEDEPIDNVIAGMNSKKDPDAVNQVLKDNPDTEEDYTRSLSKDVLKKMGGNPDLAATSWLYGTSLPQSAVQDKLANDPEYQQRINQTEQMNHGMSRPDTYFENLQRMLKTRNSKITSGGR